MGLGLLVVTQRAKKKMKLAIIITFLLLNTIISSAILSNWNNKVRSDIVYSETNVLPNEAYDTSFYLKENTGNRSLCWGVSGVRLFIGQNENILIGGTVGLASFQIDDYIYQIRVVRKEDSTLFRYDEMWVFEEDPIQKQKK